MATKFWHWAYQGLPIRISGEEWEELITLARDPDAELSELGLASGWLIDSATQSFDPYLARLLWANFWLTLRENPAWDLWVLEDGVVDRTYQSTMAQIYLALFEADLFLVFSRMLALSWPASWHRLAPSDLAMIQERWEAKSFLPRFAIRLGSPFFEISQTVSILLRYDANGRVGHGTTTLDKREAVFYQMGQYSLGYSGGASESPVGAEELTRAHQVLALAKDAR